MSCLGPAAPLASSVFLGCMRTGSMVVDIVNTGEPRDGALFGCAGPNEAPLRNAYVQCSAWANGAVGSILEGETPPVWVCGVFVPIVPLDVLPKEVAYKFVLICGDLPHVCSSFGAAFGVVAWCLSHEIIGADGRTCVQTRPGGGT